VIPDRFRRPVPWRLGDLYLLLGLVGLGAVLIGIAGLGAQHKSALADGVPWVNLAVGGVILVGIGAALWVLAGMRANSELRRLVLAELRSYTDPDAAAAAPRLPVDSHNGSESGAEVGTFVTARGMTRYHRPTCVLVAGKTVEHFDSVPADRRPCDICRSGSV